MEEQSRSNVVYGPCNRNYAAVQGNVILDGCGEFIEDSDGSPKCMACGCHSNFHLLRNVQRRNGGTEENCVTQKVEEEKEEATKTPHLQSSPAKTRKGPLGKKGQMKRYSEEEVAKMRGFASSIGWKMSNKERDPEINGFCERMGMSRQAFRIWLNNNKRYLRTASASKANSSSPSTC